MGEYFCVVINIVGEVVEMFYVIVIGELIYGYLVVCLEFDLYIIFCDF